MLVIGVNWYENFMQPVLKNGEYWIGTTPKLGRVLGGHAIDAYWASDKRQAFKLLNSWNLDYPLVWIPYTVMDRLIREEGEVCVSIDKSTIT